MARPAKRHTRREFLKNSAALAAGAAAALPFAAPAGAQRPKLNYWCYQFLKESDDARANFAREWAQKNNVDLQITMVPLKEFLPKIDRKSTRLNSSHVSISYAVFCLKKK